MAGDLDMSLEDLIKKNKKSGPSRARASSANGSIRRRPNRVAPYSTGKREQPVRAPDSAWGHDMFSKHLAAYPAQAATASAIETGTKLYVSNLEYGVSNEDIKELFSEVGDLKRFFVHFDRSGRSKGTAEVVFSRRSDAVAAVKRYDNVQLDGKPMKIEIVGTNIATNAQVPQPTNGLLGNPNNIPKSGTATVGFTGASQGGGSLGPAQAGGHGRRRGKGGRRRGRGRTDPVSAEALDADLEKYHSSAMQVN